MSKQNPMVEVWCQMCGEVFEVPNNLAGSAKWCPGCRKEAKRTAVREYDRERREMETKRRATIESIGGEYHITKDPDESWGHDSSFTYSELVKLLSDGFLAVGTEFRFEPSKTSTHRVIKHGNSCILEPIEPEQKGVAVKIREKPYWMMTKEKRTSCLSANA